MKLKNYFLTQKPKLITAVVAGLLILAVNILLDLADVRHGLILEGIIGFCASLVASYLSRRCARPPLRTQTPVSSRGLSPS